MNIPQFSWMTPVLCVSDLTKSLEYYEKSLGFSISWTWSEDNAFDETAKPTFACVASGDCCLFLCEKGQGNPGSWICLNLRTRDELDAVHSQYRRSSARIVEEPVDCPWGMREMLVEDLDGNTFRIGCALEGD